MLARVGLAARAPRHAGLAQRLGRGYRVVIKLTFYLEAGALEHYSMRFAAAREEGTSPNGRREREREREKRPRCETARKQRGKKLRSIIPAG